MFRVRAASLYIVCYLVGLAVDYFVCRKAKTLLVAGMLADYKAELDRHEVLVQKFPNEISRRWAAYEELSAAENERY